MPNDLVHIKEQQPRWERVKKLFHIVKSINDSFLNLLGECVDKYSNSSFLFSLRNKDNITPFIAKMNKGDEKNAIRCDPRFGPVFGGGRDLCIYGNPQVSQSFSRFGCTYQLPTGYVYGSKQAKSLLAGQFQFITTEFEVFN